jgi:pSer/pThr/pTyr-binding forkhead associated (FHA) protein
MSKLVLKFEKSVLQEIPVGGKEVSIGRSPDNKLVIDNPAVSYHHARVFDENGKLMLEDFDSMNGTFVNGQRVKTVALKPGDSVAIGKHTIVVNEGNVEVDPWAPPESNEPRPVAPRIDETMMLGTKDRRDFLARVAAAGESAQMAPSRLKVPTLVVRKGRAKEREFLLTDKLTVIGKSAMATVKLRGWFTPKAAAQINRREDNSYFIGPADRIPKVNGKAIAHPTRLNDGDLIEVAGVQLEFVYRD